MRDFPIKQLARGTTASAPADATRAFVILVDHRVVYEGRTARTLDQVRADYSRTVRSLTGPGGRPGLSATPYRQIYHTLAEAKIAGKCIDYAWRQPLAAI
jgi:hypothetical protein